MKNDFFVLPDDVDEGEFEEVLKFVKFEEVKGKKTVYTNRLHGRKKFLGGEDTDKDLAVRILRSDIDWYTELTRKNKKELESAQKKKKNRLQKKEKKIKKDKQKEKHVWLHGLGTRN